MVGNTPRRFTKLNKKWVLTSNVTWQEHNGELPEGMDIWFVDGNTFNDTDIKNLYLIEHKKYLEFSKKITQQLEKPMKKGNYEGREESKTKKEELFDHTKEYF